MNPFTASVHSQISPSHWQPVDFARATCVILSALLATHLTQFYDGTFARKRDVRLPLVARAGLFRPFTGSDRPVDQIFQEILHVLPNIFSVAEADLILTLLSLVDMALVGGLLVMVMFSGYENFVSQLDITEGKEKLSWLGKMDATSLKNKVAASIVAISSIHLLRVFMDAKNVPDNKLMWYVIIHLTFVLSAFVMGYLDKVTRSKH